MRRKLFSFVWVLSLVMFVATAAMWGALLDGAR